MECSNCKADFENKKTTFFSTESAAPCGMHDPEKNYFSAKLQEIDSPYFSFENFKIFLRQLKEKALSIFHLYVRGLSKNNDKLIEFLASLNVSFSDVVVTEYLVRRNSK